MFFRCCFFSTFVFTHIDILKRQFCLIYCTVHILSSQCQGVEWILTQFYHLNDNSFPCIIYEVPSKSTPKQVRNKLLFDQKLKLFSKLPNLVLLSSEKMGKSSIRKKMQNRQCLFAKSHWQQDTTKFVFFFLFLYIEYAKSDIKRAKSKTKFTEN